ncbi:MAG: HEAT repeat domain-containing protein [Planctomycetota bacterium]|nr:HEAT repeat domain-containing protein [Planctomycetota bacterium]
MSKKIPIVILSLIHLVFLGGLFAQSEEDEIGRLVRQMGDEEFAKRNEAFDLLRKKGYKILPELRKHKEKTDDVQIRHLLEKLLLLLQEEEREAKLLERVLGAGVSEEEAGEVVGLLLSDKGQFRVQGLAIIRERAGSKGLSLLLEYLMDDDLTVSVAAARMVAECGVKGERKSLENLIAAMNRVDAYSSAAEIYLHSFFRLYDATDVAVNKKLTEMAEGWRSQVVSELVLRAEAEGAVALASFLTDKGTAVRRLAIGGIGLITRSLKSDYIDVSKENSELLLEHLKTVIERGEEEEAAAAVQVVARIDSENSFKMLLDAVKNRSGAVAEAAIRGLTVRKRKEAVGVVLEAMEREPLLIPSGCILLEKSGDKSVVSLLKKLAIKPGAVFCGELLRCIASLAPEETLDTALRIISEAPLPSKQEAQIVLLKYLKGKLLSEEAGERLFNLVKDGDMAARILSADVLAQVGDENVSKKLRELMETPDAGIRTAAVKAVALLEKDTAFAQKYLEDVNFSVRWRAAEALALLGDIRPLLNLKRLSFDLPDANLREHARDLLKLYGINLFIDPEIRETKIMSLKTGSPLLEAVQKLASENNLLFDHSFGVVLFVSPERCYLYRDFKMENDRSVPLERILVTLVTRRERIRDVVNRIGEYVGFTVEISEEAAAVCDSESSLEAELVGVRAFDALRLILAPYNLKAKIEKSVLYITK